MSVLRASFFPLNTGASSTQSPDISGSTLLNHSTSPSPLQGNAHRLSGLDQLPLHVITLSEAHEAALSDKLNRTLQLEPLDG